MGWQGSFWVATGGELAGLALVAGVALLWLAVSRGLREGDLFDRLADGFLILAWLAVVTFWVFAGWGLFRLVPVISFLALSALAVLKIRGREVAAEPPNRADVSTSSPLRRLLWVVAVPWTVLVVLRLLKGLVAPPMAWDSLTYHLPKAAMWVQEGSLDLVAMPDAWSYYRWLPAGSEILWAWLMLPTRSDVLIAPIGLFIWLVIVISGRRLAALLGATGEVAWMAGLAVATLPCVLSFATSGYADNPELVFILLALIHGLAFHRSGRASAGLLSAAAVGLAVSIKTTGILVAPVLALLLVRGWTKSPSRTRGWLALALAGALLLPAIGYLYTWRETGSPLYPMKAPLLETLPYHRGYDDLHSGTILPAEVKQQSALDIGVALFWSASGTLGHLNLGLGGLVLLLLGCAGLLRGVLRRRHLDFVASAVGIGLLTLPLFFLGGSVAALRSTLWIGIIGRILIAGVAPFLFTGLLLPSRLVVSGLTVAILMNLLHARPLGFSPAVTAAALVVGALLAIAAVAMMLVTRHLQRPWARAAALLLVLAFSYVPLSLLRISARYPVWSQTGQGGSAFDGHALSPVFPLLVPAASYLDDMADKRLAVTVGAIGTGHNQFLYPFLGRRLNHRLLYVPMTVAGNDEELLTDERRERASEEAWLDRLAAAEADYVVALWPEPLEWSWVERNPERFEILGSGSSDFYQLARVR